MKTRLHSALHCLRCTKRQRYIHALVPLAHALGIYIGWKYLPPYLLHNPGIQIIVATLVISDVLHFVWHGK